MYRSRDGVSTVATLAVLAGALLILGVLSAMRAVMTARTPQGALAWVGALITVPLFAVPLYWVFGRSRFHGYVRARRHHARGHRGLVNAFSPYVSRYDVDVPEQFDGGRVLEALAHLPYTRGNLPTLLIDGEATFEAIFEVIDGAKEYILSQFFIVNDDEIGREYKDRLIRQAQAGRRVYFLYDELGSKRMTRRYLRDLRDGGVFVSGMKTTRGLTNRFQVNFRNHRKIVAADGRVAITGGQNVGDEYLDRHPKLTPWRDTSIRVEGPEALAMQLVFVEDWHWATRKVPQLVWEPRGCPNGDCTVFTLPSGPADEYETCELFFRHAISSARRRVWIATPYFVPDEGTIGALKLAAMRGIDVRILIPGLPDKPFIKLAAMSYVEEVARAGIAMYEYQKGFMHQKVMLVDDAISTVGTANFDNRSFRLNFEISIITVDEAFAADMEAMLERDFSNSRCLTAEDVAGRSHAFKASARVARLFSPVL